MLGDAGLTAHTTELERTRVVLRLPQLAATYREFCAIALDEGSLGEWRENQPEVMGEYPLLNAFYVGRLVDLVACALDEDELETPARLAVEWLTLVDQPDVACALMDQVGASELLTSMWLSTRSATVYSPSEGTVDEYLNLKDAPSSHRAFNWVQSGMPLTWLGQ